MSSPSKKARSKPRKQPRQSAFEQALGQMHHPRTEPPMVVSGVWLFKALSVVIALALLMSWVTLCLLYRQGAWQLLYHPAAAVIRTPASVGLGFESIRFDTAEDGTPQLAGWWVPAVGTSANVPTMLVLNDGSGNMSDAVPMLAALEQSRAGKLNLFTFDYRGFGASLALSGHARPSERLLLDNAGQALNYLETTRHISPSAVFVMGLGLGADLAAELAAAQHASKTGVALAGVVLVDPPFAPTAAIYNDARSRLVPAHWLVQDRYNLSEAAAGMHVPSLWLYRQGEAPHPAARMAATNRTQVWLAWPPQNDAHFAGELSRFLDGASVKAR